MGQSSSTEPTFMTKLISSTAKSGYSTIPDKKLNVMFIFDTFSIHSHSILNSVLNYFLSKLEITTASYTPQNGLNLILNAKYLNVRQALDGVEKIVLISIVDSEEKKTNSIFSSTGSFGGLYKHLSFVYPTYQRFDIFALGLLCKDFVRSDNPMLMIYDRGCVELEKGNSTRSDQKVTNNFYESNRFRANSPMIVFIWEAYGLIKPHLSPILKLYLHNLPFFVLNEKHNKFLPRRGRN